MNTMASVTKRKSEETVHDEALQKKTKYYSVEDIKHIEDLYNTILDIKNKFNAAYQENSSKLKNVFESIQLIDPECQQRISLPPMPIPEEPKRQNQPSQSSQPSAETEKPPSQSTKLIVPECQQRLSLPPMPIPDEPKRQEQLSQSTQPSAEPEKPPSQSTKLIVPECQQSLSSPPMPIPEEPKRQEQLSQSPQQSAEPEIPPSQSTKLIVPERQQRQSSPPMPIPEEPKRQEQPSQTPQPSVEPEKPPSQSKKPSTLPKRNYPTKVKKKKEKKGRVAKKYKWMLKHQEPGPGLIELMPDTGIYVDNLELKRSKLSYKTARDMRKFAKSLLKVVFSAEALSKCTFTGLCKMKRPTLDQYARTVFMEYVTKHAEESGWEIVSRKRLTYALTSKFNDMNMHFFDPNNYKNKWLKRYLEDKKALQRFC